MESLRPLYRGAFLRVLPPRPDSRHGRQRGRASADSRQGDQPGHPRHQHDSQLRLAGRAGPAYEHVARATPGAGRDDRLVHRAQAGDRAAAEDPGESHAAGYRPTDTDRIDDARRGHGPPCHARHRRRRRARHRDSEPAARGAAAACRPSRQSSAHSESRCRLD